MNAQEKRYDGQCYCGAVKIVVTGDPLGAGYCHCKNCRSWSSGPVNAFTLWPPEAVEVTEGAEHIGWRVIRCGTSSTSSREPFHRSPSRPVCT
jgi:hypothetical protein